MDVLDKKLNTILQILDVFNKRIYIMQEQLEHCEQLCTSTNAYVRKNNRRVEEAMKTCHAAFKLSANAQYNLQEDLDTFAGTVSSDDRVKII